MADWDDTKVHCKVTWITLVDLDQTARGFATAGKVACRNLTFYEPNASAEVLRARARTLAISCDNLFRRFYGATYETDVSRARAVNGAIRVLLADGTTVADLAAENNANYVYFGE